MIDSLKKKQIILYNLNDGHLTKQIELKVICKERWGDAIVIKCKVLSKNLEYKEIYITQNDLYSGSVKLKN
jgi:hypothetical protein